MRSKALFTILMAVAIPHRVDAQPMAGSSFIGLGTLDARDLSADGDVIVGNNMQTGRASVWSDGSIADLGASEALGTSNDGSVVIGFDGSRMVRWTAESGVEKLGVNIPAGSGVSAVSDDGSRYVGWMTVPDFRVPAAISSEAEPWAAVRAENGQVFALLDDEGRNVFGQAIDASSDGSTIVGYRWEVDKSESVRSQAFRWDDGEFETLGFLPGGGESRATAITADGAMVIGDSQNASGQWETFLWQEGQLTALGVPAGFDGTQATDASADASVIVGTATSDVGGSQPFIWTGSEGMQLLQDVLSADYGLDLSGWTLQSAHEISGDGRAIVGVGLNPSGKEESWLAVLSQQGDFDRNGVVSALDADLICSAIADQGTAAMFDIAVDGQLDPSDMDAFLDAINRLPADGDLDGEVAFEEFSKLAANFGLEGTWSDGDYTCNGLVSFPDFGLLAEHFGQSTVAASAAEATVSEPSGGLLAILALGGIVSALRRRARQA